MESVQHSVSTEPQTAAVANQVDVIVSGHLCMDLIPEMGTVSREKMTIPGRLLETGPMDIATGGAVSNTGISLHRLGVNVRLMATVGGDLLGQAIIGYLNSQNPALSQYITTQPGQATSYSIVLTPEHSDRTFLHCTGTNSVFGVNNINFDLVAGARIFHLGYPPLLPQLLANDGEELYQMCQRVRAVGTVMSVDTVMTDPKGSTKDLRWPRIWQRCLPEVDIFMPSIEELLLMLRRSDYDAWEGRALSHLTRQYLHDLAGELLDLGTAIVGFKLGEMGIYLRTNSAERIAKLSALQIDVNAWANCELWVPAFQVKVAGTTGAGDAAFAGFLAALLRGLPPEEALRRACAVGACTVEAVDSTSGIRSWADTEARLQAGWSARPDRLAGF